MKLSDITPNKLSSTYEQPSADIIKWLIIKPAKKNTHASHFTKNISSINLEGDILLQIQKVWDAISYNF